MKHGDRVRLALRPAEWDHRPLVKRTEPRNRELCDAELCAVAGIKLPATQVLGPLLRSVPEAPLPIEHAYSVRRRRGGQVSREGYRTASVLASYVHAHWASNPLVPEGLVASAAAHREELGR